MPWKKSLIAILVLAVGFHIVILDQTPRWVMAYVFYYLEAEGYKKHGFEISPSPASPTNQPIVRPSPDLAYSLCWFDLSDGPVVVKGKEWEDYASLSVFDMNTDVVFITSLQQNTPGPRGGVLMIDKGLDVAMSEQTLPEMAADLPKIKLDFMQGLVLIRRLAPSSESYERAYQLGQADICAPLKAEES